MPKVFISFATEDFVSPQHDDVLLRLTGMLEKRGITGDFHVTGDLVRSLRDRRRTDVIKALGRHEIGYHSNTHGASLASLVARGVRKVKERIILYMRAFCLLTSPLMDDPGPSGRGVLRVALPHGVFRQYWQLHE